MPRPTVIVRGTMLTTALLALTLAADPAGPLRADDATISRGPVRAAGPLVQTFKLTNPGRRSLLLTEVAGVCGCLKPAFGTRKLGPGEGTELRVEINLLTQPAGPATWRMAVRYRVEPGTGDEKIEEAELVLQIAADVVKDVAVEPVALQLTGDKDLRRTITLTDGRAKPLTATGVRLTSKFLTATLGKPAKDKDGRTVQAVELVVNDDCPAGLMTDDVCIDTDDPLYREFRVPVRMLKRAAATATVAAVPESATLRFAAGQATASTLVRLRDPSERPVEVAKAECDSDAVACKWAAADDGSVTVRVTVGGVKTSGVAVVKLTLAKPAATTVSIPVAWTVP